MTQKPVYFSKPNYRTKSEFAKLIKESVRKETKGVKGLRVEWHWFKKQVTYPTGLKGSTGKLTLHTEGFKSREYILTASYSPNGNFEWRIV